MTQISIQPENAVKNAIDLDPYLEPFSAVIMKRQTRLRDLLQELEKEEGGLDEFTNGYDHFGFRPYQDGSILYSEWAPNAIQAHVFGDFNDWNRTSHPMKRDEWGKWHIKIPPNSNNDRNLAIPHLSRVKICFELPDGRIIDRISPWIKYCIQSDPQKNPTYDAIFWHPSDPYIMKHPSPIIPENEGLLIYEAHVGISTPEAKIATYNEFTENILPRVAKLGYHCIQLMAVMEHAYYASFGYQVTSFFASSSRFGTPDDLKRLVDTAHQMGLLVLLDVVHSHASNNVLDGLNQFDGSDHLYFHDGSKGRHDMWDSRLFNYGHREVLRFLLSNLRYYRDKFGFDGFRFDGVTSMLYKHHGIYYSFTGDYQEYFSDHLVDEDAIMYLCLVNLFFDSSITIAEDVSGMPLLCRPISEGGIGFDYRLGMAIPDMWIKLLKESSDDSWNMGHIVYVLTNRRYKEKTISYCESHDQALVGDKTIAFWLMDKEMYDWMTLMRPSTSIIERGIALHKMIRLITLGLGGEGYLTFMGNEFGHPEWLDFPRPGNQFSYHYCRRQYNLPDDPLLRYHYLSDFETSMLNLAKEYNVLSSQTYVSLKHEDDKIIVFERGDLIWIFNFHSFKSFVHYRISVTNPGKYIIKLDTDDLCYGGQGRIDHDQSEYFTKSLSWNGLQHCISVYIPCRTALICSRE